MCALITALRAENALLLHGPAAAADIVAPSPLPWTVAPGFVDGMLRVARARAGVRPSKASNDRLPLAMQLELDGRYADAADAWLALGDPFEAAMARTRCGGADGGIHLRQAFEEFDAIGAISGINYVQRIATDLDVQLGASSRKRGPYRGARSHPLGLTRREVDILKMIVEGAPNRDIAARLNRSLRTIEPHVSNILGKMSMESRVQAALHAITNPAILENADEDPDLP